MNAQHPTSTSQLSTSGIQQRANPNTKYDLEDRLLEFAAQIILLVEKLPNSRSGNHIAGQLLRCGTSPLPNHGEAQAAESAADFIHKMSICLKELRAPLASPHEKGLGEQIAYRSKFPAFRNRGTDKNLCLEHSHCERKPNQTKNPVAPDIESWTLSVEC